MNLALPLGLYLLALIVRLVAASQLSFPTAEPSAWYFGVAENLLAGRGLVSDTVWSYATPPLEVPKPAFELWLPMSTFVSAGAMAVLGSTFWAAQVGGALLGALVAPLAWAVGREAARVQGLDDRRGRSVAMAAGLLTAVLSPLVVGSVIPESFLPFTVFSLLAALLVPRALGVRAGEPSTLRSGPGWGVALGLAMGLAYLSRQEIIWLGLTVVLMLGWVARARPTGDHARYLVARLWPIVLGGLLVVGPWLVRNALDLGSAFPGQAVENMFLTRNEDIFAFLDRPDAARYLDQGIATVLGNPARAAWDGLFNVITVTAFPVGIVGLASAVALHRSRAIRRPTALSVLLLSGGLTFASTMLLFPVASLWGTFMHASGPLLVGLTIMAALGGDALLARISALRRWEKPNVILAPVALIAVAGLLAVFQLRILAEQSRETESRYAAVAAAVGSHAQDTGRPVPETVITDHPMWVADALGGSAIALPDEDPAAVIELARRFDAPWLVLVDERGAYPDALLAEPGRGCLAADPVRLTQDESPAWLFELAARCSEP